ncbi:MAG: META domain-containing protein [Rhodobacteraceae bacterium]|nr:META domain-containing protein [Paracoccaceae bacterium]
MLRLVLTLPILLSACLKDESVSGYADPGAVYRLGELSGAEFTARATISFPGAGEVRGQGPCNSYSARQTVPYPWIRIEALAATRRACPELVDEAAFFGALEAMTLAEVAGGVLILSNDEGAEMVFRAAQD